MSQERQGASSDPDKPYDAGEPADVKKAQQGARRKQSLLDEVTVQLMSTKNGRAWIAQRLADAGVFHTPFSVDPHQTAFNCGRHSAGLQLLAEVTRVAPALYIKLLEEQAK